LSTASTSPSTSPPASPSASLSTSQPGSSPASQPTSPALAGAAEPEPRARRHLLSVGDLGREGIEELLRLSDAFVEVSKRPIPKVPALRGRTVATLFAEDSTRTRLSFETAARRLSADVMTFHVPSSSVNKGESLRDTAETLAAIGVDALVVRHRSPGVPAQVARWVDVSVVNAGDGAHEHPTQALLDCVTVRQVLAERAGAPLQSFGTECFEDLRVTIVGDVRNSRVARSEVAAMSSLGARVRLVAPGSLLPASLEGWPVEVANSLDEVIEDTDVCYLLRLQAERGAGSLVPSLREYASMFGLTKERAARLPEGAMVMHPGPVMRGVEVASEVADSPLALFRRQVANGVVLRMAVLFWLLGAGPVAPQETSAVMAETGADDDGPGRFGDLPGVAPAGHRKPPRAMQAKARGASVG
jgi:aspartate carbamoyltransferase catalytic subunit